VSEILCRFGDSTQIYLDALIEVLLREEPLKRSGYCPADDGFEFLHSGTMSADFATEMPQGESFCSVACRSWANVCFRLRNTLVVGGIYTNLDEKENGGRGSSVARVS
jgi:hypothetical protein